MKTDADLEQIFDTIRADHHQLRRDVVVPSVKLLRSIQIDALREVREIVLSARAQMDEAVGTKAEIISGLDELLRELELK